jgi:hypothetical protein
MLLCLLAFPSATKRESVKNSLFISDTSEREREGKAANGLRGEPARGLARDMGGMVVENDLDGGVGDPFSNLPLAVSGISDNA